MPSGWEWIIVLLVVLLLFGGAKLPKLARSLGEAKKEFEDGVTKARADSVDADSDKPAKSAKSDKSDPIANPEKGDAES